MENSNEKTVRYLKDLHAAEAGTADIFEGLSKDNDLEASLRQQAAGFHQTTRDQAQAIEQRLHALGADNSGAKDFMNNLLSKASDILNIGHDDEDKLTQDLIKAFAATHLHMGAYESLRAYASTIGDQESVQLAIRGIEQEKQIGQGVFSAIGRKAPTSAGNATDTSNSLGATV